MPIGDVKEDDFEKEINEPSYTDLQQRFISTQPCKIMPENNTINDGSFMHGIKCIFM